MAPTTTWLMQAALLIAAARAIQDRAELNPALVRSEEEHAEPVLAGSDAFIEDSVEDVADGGDDAGVDEEIDEGQRKWGKGAQGKGNGWGRGGKWGGGADMSDSDADDSGSRQDKGRGKESRQREQKEENKKKQQEEGKDGKEGKGGKDGKESTDGKDAQDGKEGKGGKDGKESTDGKDAQEGKGGKDGKDAKEGKGGKDGKEGKGGKDGAQGTMTIAFLNRTESKCDALETHRLNFNYVPDFSQCGGCSPSTTTAAGGDDVSAGFISVNVCRTSVGALRMEVYSNSTCAGMLTYGEFDALQGCTYVKNKDLYITVTGTGGFNLDAMKFCNCTQDSPVTWEDKQAAAAEAESQSAPAE